ncbi:unnamed protein product [Eruca vesicaria subsp. sativa]|uniref:Uncharacterized protein n=1 Tax=Eruca vesicaria subsp. sativa TaxID=29727 RepID=A0ABC8K7P7_ERUVS|nr:unnamed protein product [Eruca vesicaria subsp. sativa]
MESSCFQSKKPLTVNELYTEWSKNLTEYCLPLLRESIYSDPRAIVPDTDVDNVMYYLIHHYETLITSSDNNTIRHILFPSGNETQLFFIGDIHPCLFTCLIRSLIDSDEQVKRVDEIERCMMLSVNNLVEQMSRVHIRFVARVSKNWVEATEEASSVMEAVDDAAEEEKEELVRIFVAANNLRKSVLKDIFKATTGIQAALFLESLCAFLDGFKDQNSPPLIDQQQHAAAPSLPHDLEKKKVEGQQHTSEADESPNRILWIGDVRDKTETEYLYRCFAKTGEDVSIRVPTHKVTGKSLGFGFIEFQSADAAEQALHKYNNTLMPGLVPSRRFRLMWAKKTATDSIFVGDLARDVTDQMLLKTFTDNGYSSAISATVSFDRVGRSKGYGFVTFSDHGQLLLAVERMNGVECSSRPMRIAHRRGN